MFWTIVWSVLGLVVLGVEVVTLKNEDKDDTLSWNVWNLQRSAVLRAGAMALWFWLTWHWFVENLWVPEGLGKVWDDWLIVAFGAVVGLVSSPKVREKLKDHVE